MQKSGENDNNFFFLSIINFVLNEKNVSVDNNMFYCFWCISKLKPLDIFTIMSNIAINVNSRLVLACYKLSNKKKIRYCVYTMLYECDKAPYSNCL